MAEPGPTPQAPTPQATVRRSRRLRLSLRLARADRRRGGRRLPVLADRDRRRPDHRDRLCRRHQHRRGLQAGVSGRPGRRRAVGRARQRPPARQRDGPAAQARRRPRARGVAVLDRRAAGQRRPGDRPRYPAVGLVHPGGAGRRRRGHALRRPRQSAGAEPGRRQFRDLSGVRRRRVAVTGLAGQLPRHRRRRDRRRHPAAGRLAGPARGRDHARACVSGADQLGVLAYQRRALRPAAPGSQDRHQLGREPDPRRRRVRDPGAVGRSGRPERAVRAARPVAGQLRDRAQDRACTWC